MKKYLIAVLIIFSLTPYAKAQVATEETITLTTYYPSPYGVYKTLRIFPDGRPATCQEGELYYDDGSSGNPRGLYLCGAGPVWGPIAGYWTLAGTNLYPNDTNWNVGIGTTVPTQKLDIDGNIQIRGDRTNLYGKDSVGYHWFNTRNDAGALETTLGFKNKGGARNVVVENGWNLEVRKDLYVKENLLINGWTINENPVNNNLRFYYGGTKKAAVWASDGTWNAVSDISLKKEIKNLSRYGLDAVKSMRPVEFKWKDNDKEDIGFIAQEIKEIIPGAVSGEEGEMSIGYSKLTVVLVQAIQELNKKVENQETEIKRLKSTLCSNNTLKEFCQ